MHDLQDFLAEIRAAGIELWVRGGRLCYRPPDGPDGETLAEIRRRKSEIIAHLDRADSPPAAARRPSVVPLCSAQEGLWLIEHINPGTAAYNLPLVLRLRGALDVPALLGAFADLEARHEILRTRYPAADGLPRQDVLDPGNLDIEVTDLSAADAADARRYVQDVAEQPFPLETNSPFRVRLGRLSADEHVLIIVLHHIAGDEASFAVLTDDLGEFYTARIDGRAARRPPLAVQYADFALSQRRQLETGELDAQLSYWRRRLEDAPEGLRLPADRPRRGLPTFSGGLLEFGWSERLTGRVLETARRANLTPYMLLLAAYQIFLARWSGQSDLCVGTPVAAYRGRTTEHLIGNFLNTLVMRAQPQADVTAADFLEETGRRVLEAYQNRELPFDRLVAELGSSVRSAASPLFQTLFAFETGGAGQLRLAGLETERMLTELHTALFDLGLTMTLDGTRLRGGFEYDTALFDRSTIERAAAGFERIVTAIVEAPGTRIGDLPLPGAVERRDALKAGAAAAATQAVDGTLTAMIASPPSGDATAVIHRDTSVSYAALDRMSNRVARCLRSMGIGREDVVGICMPRSADMIAGLLGILKAGAAYLPLDPGYPAERLKYMIADCSARVVLGRREHVLPLGLAEARSLCLDRDRERIAQFPSDPPADRSHASDLAYILYTSGSTGAPKGVMVEHRSAAALLAWAGTVFGPEDTRYTVALTSLSFDLSVFELFLPLTAGGTIVLVEDALSLADNSPAVEPTLLNTVPSAARALINRNAIPAGVRTINLAGEPLPRGLVEALYGAAPRARVLNLYGPTEDTTYSTWCHVRSDPAADVGIGRPVAGTEAYVLDDYGEPVPPGAPGQIHLAGRGLARGYRGRPGLTAERFVPNPFGPPGSRMYATGDMGRFRPDGSLDFLGRIDQQLKIRGHRIEPGEIEASLHRICGIAQAAVVTREAPSGATKLIAHVTAESGRTVDAAFLRTELSRSLPGYMIPDVFEIRDRLPLTANGKIDRRQLAALAPLSQGEREDHSEPRTETELRIAKVWAEVLEVDRVGIDDDFFALGGYSILASQIIARLRREPESGLILRDIFEAPTIRQLVARLDGRHKAPVKAVVPARAADMVPASFAQERLWFIDQFTPGLSLYNIAVAWSLKGDLDPDALRLALQEIVRRHDSLRTRFAASDGGPPIQNVSGDGSVTLPVTEVPASGDARSAARALLAEDAQKPFDLANGPVFRTILVRLGRTEHFLQVTIPHIVVDGWSVEIVMRELAALYTAFHAGRPSPLPPLPIQYRDFARWQRAYLTGDVLDGHRCFWRERLRNIPKELQLDSDRPRPPAASFRGDSVSLTLDAALTADLRRLARSQAATVFMLMSAVFSVLLFRYSRQGDFCIGYPSGNRTRRETEDLIGLFVNTLVMRIETRAGMPFRDLLTAVRDDVLAADQHQDYPFEKLVEDLQPVRDPSHHPIFQVWCSHARTRSAATGRVGGFGAERDRDLELPGLKAELIEVPDRTAKFDLSMFITETGDALKVDLEYAADLFDRSTVERMAGQFRTICREVARDPGRPVGELELLTEPERHRILVDWNRTPPPAGVAGSLHEAFERQVARTPNNVAVQAGSRTLSYGGLNERANRLARHLQSLGVGPESLVGILLGRGPDLVTGLLAVLKAGGAYVPLDAAYPARRLAYMLEDSKAGVVLTSAAEAANLPPFPGLTVLIDEELNGAAWPPSGNPGVKVTPESLAYCLYTSGSTGHPKAVAIGHGSAMGLLNWAARVYSTEETGRLLAATSVCFDLSVFEIFLPLARGGTVVLADDISLAGAAGEPTLINTVPSSMNALAAAGAVPKSVGTINLAGEPLDPSLVAILRAAAPGARIFNLYGPTEATTYATFTEIGADNRVTIGRPVDTAAVYILDDRLEPVPIGVTGHLHIGGPCLARGYLGRPGLTAERFLPDPFGPAGGRIYATGDRARFLADGHIEFRGRTDHQVKFHGNRIELNEIEHALMNCPGVREAAVAVLKDAEGTDRLAGFVTVDREEGLSDRSVAAELKKALPRSMLPHPLKIVGSLPHLPNGKIDRNALRLEQTASDLDGDAQGAPPTTANEILLAGLWQQLLGLPSVGIHSSFFSLGGHSMTAIQMSARLAQSTGSVVPLRVIFEHPTIAELAAYLDSGPQQDDTDARLQPIPRFDRSRRVRPSGIGAAAS
jgi:amino acid adenylation domain-containing protein